MLSARTTTTFGAPSGGTVRGSHDGSEAANVSPTVPANPG